MVGYSMKMDPEKTAKSIGFEMPISLKDSVVVCDSLRGQMLDDATKYLKEVIDKKRAVPYKRFNSSISHRKGGFIGRYPVKVAKHILEVLVNVESNAEHKDLDTENLRIKHIAAQKGRTIKRSRPRAHGRSSAINRDRVNIEIIVEEVEA